MSVRLALAWPLCLMIRGHPVRLALLRGKQDKEDGIECRRAKICALARTENGSSIMGVSKRMQDIYHAYPNPMATINLETHAYVRTYVINRDKPEGCTVAVDPNHQVPRHFTHPTTLHARQKCKQKILPYANYCTHVSSRRPTIGQPVCPFFFSVPYSSITPPRCSKQCMYVLHIARRSGFGCSDTLGLLPCSLPYVSQ